MPKSHRNSQCYCGSGLKYKKCCMKQWQHNFDRAQEAREKGEIYIPLLDDVQKSPQDELVEQVQEISAKIHEGVRKDGEEAPLVRKAREALAQAEKERLDVGADEKLG